MSTLWLIRDNHDLVSWCTCDTGIVGSLPQMDCPWCGCGWLFSCVSCRKCFTFARAERIPESLEDIARQDIKGFSKKAKPSDSEIAEWIESNSWMIDNLEEGDRVVVLDGAVIPVNHRGPLKYKGWFAKHNLRWLPQVRALKHPEIEETVLSSIDYWQSRELPDRD